MVPSHVAVATSRTQERSLRTRLVSQFGHPRGIAGRLAGWVMAYRPSNRRRNAWTVDLLDLQPGGRVLEIGFGPGLSLHRIASRVGTPGLVAGIDLSDTMLSQAQHRNRVAVASARMDLRVASVTHLPDFGASFDAVLAVKTIGFWPDLPSRSREIRERLVPEGRFAVTMQPRSKGATAATTEQLRLEIEANLCAAGFVDVTAHTLDLKPLAVCVIGVRRKEDEQSNAADLLRSCRSDSAPMRSIVRSGSAARCSLP